MTEVLRESLDSNRFAITPSDTELLKVPVDLIYAVGTGIIRVSRGNQAAVDIPVAANGSVFVGGVTKVHATGTTATDLTGVASKALR